MNQINIIGRLTRDPELSYLQSGKAVAKFGVAVQRPFNNKEGKKDADFFNIVAWGKQAEHGATYLFKGRLVGINGRLQSRIYVHEEKNKTIVEIIANEIEFLDWEKDKNKNSNNLVNSNEKSFEPNNKTDKNNKIEGFEALDDDDIPF